VAAYVRQEGSTSTRLASPNEIRWSSWYSVVKSQVAILPYLQSLCERADDRGHEFRDVGKRLRARCQADGLDLEGHVRQVTELYGWFGRTIRVFQQFLQRADVAQLFILFSKWEALNVELRSTDLPHWLTPAAVAMADDLHWRLIDAGLLPLAKAAASLDGFRLVFEASQQADWARRAAYARAGARPVPPYPSGMMKEDDREEGRAAYAQMIARMIIEEARIGAGPPPNQLGDVRVCGVGSKLDQRFGSGQSPRRAPIISPASTSGHQPVEMDVGAVVEQADEELRLYAADPFPSSPPGAGPGAAYWRKVIDDVCYVSQALRIRDKYPHVARFMSKFIAFPASSARLEGVFSFGSQIQKHHGTRLMPATLNALMLAHICKADFEESLRRGIDEWRSQPGWRSRVNIPTMDASQWDGISLGSDCIEAVIAALLASPPEFRDVCGGRAPTGFPERDFARDVTAPPDADEDFSTHDLCDFPGVCEGPASRADVADILREACHVLTEAPQPLDEVS
jgi:hypothetical protein